MPPTNDQKYGMLITIINRVVTTNNDGTPRFRQDVIDDVTEEFHAYLTLLN